MRSVALILLLFLQACGSTSPPPCPFKGEPDTAPSAGCLAIVHGRLLLVENRAGKVSPPGGKANASESAQCTAHRETWEETGLDLIPGALVATFDTGFNLYYCEIHAGSGQLEPPRPLEVKRAYWLPVQDVERVNWRFPGQGEILSGLLHKNTEQAP